MFRIVFATALAVSLLPAAAQTSSTPQHTDEPGFTLHQTVEEVLLYCTVVDRKGQLVTDLDRNAFHVSEDKHSVVLGQFTSQDTPISLALLLDDSDSMRDKHAALLAAAKVLIDASRPEDELSLTNFADEAYVDQDLTSNLGLARHALEAGSSVSGGTALFDTLLSTADHLGTAAHSGKRVIVVLSDGRDNASDADLQGAIARVQQTDGPVIYTIGLTYDLPGNEARRARKDLKTLSEETGGVAIFPDAPDRVPQAAAEIARDLRHQYRIAFHPLPETTLGKYHTVAVSASAHGRGGLLVRTRKGFVRRANAVTAPAGTQ